MANPSGRFSGLRWANSRVEPLAMKLSTTMFDSLLFCGQPSLVPSGGTTTCIPSARIKDTRLVKRPVKLPTIVSLGMVMSGVVCGLRSRRKVTPSAIQPGCGKYIWWKLLIATVLEVASARSSITLSRVNGQFRATSRRVTIIATATANAPAANHLLCCLSGDEIRLPGDACSVADSTNG